MWNGYPHLLISVYSLPCLHTAFHTPLSFLINCNTASSRNEKQHGALLPACLTATRLQTADSIRLLRGPRSRVVMHHRSVSLLLLFTISAIPHMHRRKCTHDSVSTVIWLVQYQYWLSSYKYYMCVDNSLRQQPCVNVAPLYIYMQVFTCVCVCIRVWVSMFGSLKPMYMLVYACIGFCHKEILSVCVCLYISVTCIHIDFSECEFEECVSRRTDRRARTEFKSRSLCSLKIQVLSLLRSVLRMEIPPNMPRIPIKSYNPLPPTAIEAWQLREGRRCDWRTWQVILQSAISHTLMGFKGCGLKLFCPFAQGQNWHGHWDNWIDVGMCVAISFLFNSSDSLIRHGSRSLIIFSAG